MKNHLFSFGFVLVVGCNAALQNQHNLTDNPALTQSAPEAPSFQPLEKTDSARYYNAVRNFFDKALITRNFNGGVLVAKDNAVLFEQYNGYKNPRKKEDELDAETPMHIASVSKTFTGMATLRLIQENKIHLDDPLTNFFPDFPYEGVTVEMLLNHRSGLPNYVHYLQEMGWDKKVFATNEDVLKSLYTMHPRASFKAGTRFAYSNTNFLLLAMIIEKVTGMPYPAYMKQNIFDPLQLTNTYVFSLADTATATPSFKANGGLWTLDCLDGTYGDKNIYTTPRDLLKWSMAITGGQFIRQSLLDSAFTPYSNEKKSVHNYGLAFRLLMLPNGKKVIYHNGRWHGSNAAFAMLPDENATIIIIGNKYNTNIYNSARKAYDIFGDYQQGGPLVDDDGDITFREPVVVKHRTSSHKRSVARKSSSKKYASSSRKTGTRRK